MFSSDERLEVVPHFTGNACVAKRDIRRHERFYYWGINMGLIEDTDSDYVLTVYDNSTSLDPSPFKDSKLQFANAPGKCETFNMTSTKNIYYDRNLVAQEFRTIRNIPRGTQVLISYGSDEWFSERKIEIVKVS